MIRLRMIFIAGSTALLLCIASLVVLENVVASDNTLSAAASTVSVHLPANAAVTAGTVVTVALSLPLDVTDLGILAYQFTVRFDPAVLQGQGTTQVETLSSNWDVVSNPNVAGEIRVAGYGTASLAGSGVLVNLAFNVIGAVGSTSALIFSDVQFNEGSPTFEPHNGSVTVVAPPVADFTATPTNGNRPLTVYFTDLSTNTVTSRLWDFGDGGSSNQTNPQHEYTSVGTYTVTLALSGPGGSDTRKRANYIVVSEPIVTAEAGGPYSVDEGSSITLDGVGTDPSGVNGPLTFSWDMNNDGSFETSGQHPIFNASGLDGPATQPVRLRVTNRVGTTATDTASVTIRNVAPTAVDDDLATDEDHPQSVPAPGILTNDHDPGDPLIVTNFDRVTAQGAAVSIEATGAITYDPRLSANLQALADGATVVDTFMYVVDDGDGMQATASVKITVTGVNDPPTATDDQGTAVEDKAVVLDILANDEDVDGDNLSVIALSPASHGTVTNQSVKVLYTPAANYNGVDTFTYTLSDGKASDSATVRITVGAANDRPNAQADEFVTSEDAPLVGNAPGLLLNDSDSDTDTLGVVGYQAASVSGASVQVKPTGGYQYDPTNSPTLQALAAGTNVIDTFAYTISDPAGLTAVAEVVITVNGLNDAPRAGDKHFSIAENSPIGSVIGSLDATDPDVGDHVGFVIISGNTGNTFAIGSASGQLSVAKDLDFECNENYELTVRITDAHEGSTEAIVTIDITDQNDGPSQCVTIPTEGGSIKLVANDSTIDASFPPGALSEPATFSMVQTDGHSISSTQKLIGSPFLISAIGLNGVPIIELAKPFTLTISLGESWGELKGNETLQLYKWDTQLLQYVEVGVIIEVHADQLVILVDSLGEFALLESTIDVPQTQRLYLPNIRPATAH